MQTKTNGSFAVVTGASSGIGLELAKQFAQHGFDLLVVSADYAERRARSEGSLMEEVLSEGRVLVDV